MFDIAFFNTDAKIDKYYNKKKHSKCQVNIDKYSKIFEADTVFKNFIPKICKF